MCACYLPSCLACLTSSSPPHLPLLPLPTPVFTTPRWTPPSPCYLAGSRVLMKRTPLPPPPHHTQGFDHPEAPALDLDSAARQLQEATAQGIKKWLGKVRE